MINAAHWLFYSTNPDADRAFFRDVLQFPALDIGHGWLLFKMPPSEAAVHPTGDAFTQRHAERNMMGAVLYLMCDDLAAVIAALKKKGVECAPTVEADWGVSTAIPLP